MFISELRPEDQLLICIARRDLDESTAQSIRGLLNRNGFDWEYVLARATSHGVAALLAHHLQSIKCEVVPDSVLLQLQTENQQNSERCLWLAGELARLTAAMQKAGIPCIPFKGPTLAITAYRDLGLRQFTDLDLFVHTRDVARAKEVLAQLGFKPVRNLSSAREAAFLRFDNACAFDNDRDVLLDLHWRFSPVHSSLPLETDDFWRRLESVNIGKQTLSTLSAEDLLLVLCCHGFTHEWERLIWICDVATLIGQRKDLDWNYLFRKSKRLGVLRIILVGLMLAGELGASLPRQVSDRIERNDAVSRCADELMTRLFTSRKGHLSLLEWLRRQLQMRERARDKLKSLLRIMFTPRDYDMMFASVPASLSLLYYLIRPIRMARAYGLRLLNTGSAPN
jgi:putative nucleotidyltransferase-like protein